MKVILTQKVSSLGNVGEIVNVSQGYARNYLIPGGFAVQANDKNQKELENNKKALAKKIAEEKVAAQEVANKINGLNLEIVKRVNSNGSLFGSVSAHELSELVSKEISTEVERRVFLIENPIKTLGEYKVSAKLFADVDATFSVKVIMDPAQAEELKKKQEELAALKAAAEAKAAEATEETESKEESAPMTEEQKLKAEADRLLRS